MTSRSDHLAALKVRIARIEAELEAVRCALHDVLEDADAEIEGLGIENGCLRNALLARLEHEGILGSTGYDTMAAHNAAVERIRRLTDTALSRGGDPGCWERVVDQLSGVLHALARRLERARPRPPRA